jgi:hypothetical protein
MIRRTIILLLALALVLLALGGALVQLVRGERPALLPA